MPARTTVTARIVAEDKASTELGKVESRFTRLQNSIRSNALKITAVLGTLTVAFRQLNETARLEGQTEALKQNLASQGVAFDGFIKKLDEVSRGTVSTAKLIESSSKALLLGIPAEQIADLLEIARVSSIATGESVSKAFDDIATGIGRASPLILDNLGIVVKLGPAYDDYAASVGKTAKELTPLEQKQALLNEVLRVGAERSKTFGEAQGELSLRLQQSAAAAENFQQGAGRLASVLALGLGAVVTRAGAGFVLLARGVALVTANLARLASVLPGVGGKFSEIADEATRIDSRLGATARSMQTLADQMSQGADIAGAALLGLSKDAEKAVQNVDALNKSMDGIGASATNAAGSVSTLAESTDQLAEAFALLGVESDRSVTDKLAQAKDALDKIEAAYKSGEASLGSYLRAQAAFNEAQDEANAKLRASAESTRILTRAQQLNRDAYYDEVEAIEASTRALDRNLTARNQSIQARTQSDPLITRGTISGGTFTTITRNGERVRVAPTGRWWGTF